MAQTRKLALVVRRGPTGPVVVAASLVTAAACGADVVVSEPVTSGSAAGGSTAAAGGSSQGGAFQPVVSSSTIGSGGAGGCERHETPYTFSVSLPPEGVPATAGQICGVMMGGPVESNNAARVTLVKDPQALHLASGEVTIAPALLPDVVGLPSIEVVSSPIPELMQMAVSNVTPTSTGFSFDVAWPPPLQLDADESTTMVVRTTFDLACPPNQSKQVEAHTHVNLCDEPNDVAWVSSGDECTICGIIAEMAPSPIVPDRSADAIGLGQVIRLRLVVVGRVGASLVLLAEHDGGASLEYQWVASGGDITVIAPDVVLWTPRDNGDVLQVAVLSDDGAAVASYSNVPVRDAGLVA